MNIFYDHEVDALYIRLGQDTPDGVSEISDGVNVDLTPDGKIVGIEILEASKKIDLRTMFVYRLKVDQQQLFRKAA